MSQQDRGRTARRALATIGAAALALLGAVAAGGAAHADTLVGNINPEETGSITVHKFVQPEEPGDFNPDGSSSTAGFDPLSGVDFTLYQVPTDEIDLTTAEGWDIVDGLTVNADGTITGYTTELVETKPTVSGVAEFTGLEIAVYVVVEGTDHGSNNITSKAAPFIVTVPLPDNGTWLYDVHAYPKNSITAVEKTVDDSEAYELGDTVTWTVTAQIPQMAPDVDLTSFSVRDTFDDRLGNLAVDSVTLGGTLLDPADYVVGGTGQTLTVTPDLDLVNAAQGGEIVVVFSSTVESIDVAEGDEVNDPGVIVNTAFADIDGSEFTSNPVDTRWGALKIVKHAGQNQADRLNDAQFALFVNEEDADDALAGDTPANGPLWTGTVTTGGEILIPGLKEGTYYLVEMVPPPGYDRHEAVITVEVEAGSTADAEIAYVSNTQKPPVDLPLTGSTGTAIFIAGGLGLIGIAVGASLIAIRRRQTAIEK